MSSSAGLSLVPGIPLLSQSFLQAAGGVLYCQLSRGQRPFSCVFCSGHSLRFPTTALDQKEIKCFLDEEWASMPCKLMGP